MAVECNANCMMVVVPGKTSRETRAVTYPSACAWMPYVPGLSGRVRLAPSNPTPSMRTLTGTGNVVVGVRSHPIVSGGGAAAAGHWNCVVVTGSPGEPPRVAWRAVLAAATTAGRYVTESMRIPG